MGTMHLYGRAGDIVMSMAAASVITEAEEGECPSLCVHGNYAEMATQLMTIGMPIRRILESPIPPSLSDNVIFGSSVARMSSVMLSSLFDFADSPHYNCCLSNVPKGKHIADVMCYLTGLCSSVSACEFPYPAAKFSYRGKGGFVVYHFGCSRRGDEINMPRCPFPDLPSVFVGSKNDPIMPWANVDMRGAPWPELIDAMLDSRACVGSDSLITNFSSLLRVPTVAIHNCHAAMVTSSRSAYGTHAHSILEKEGDKNVFEVINLLSRYIEK
jgi:hypothetical protein